MRTKHETGMLSQQDVERFLASTRRLDSGCWEWLRGRNRQGYGKFTFMRRTAKESVNVTKVATHAAFFVRHGRWPLEGLVLMHSCDAPSCVNPDHLSEASYAENSADMRKKRRQARGERCARSVLTEENVAEIRSLYSTGSHTQAALAKMFGVVAANIHFIVTNQTWRTAT
jgi:hypothetical protein